MKNKLCEFIPNKFVLVSANVDASDVHTEVDYFQCVSGKCFQFGKLNNYVVW